MPVDTSGIKRVGRPNSARDSASSVVRMVKPARHHADDGVDAPSSVIGRPTSPASPPYRRCQSPVAQDGFGLRVGRELAPDGECAAEERWCVRAVEVVCCHPVHPAPRVALARRSGSRARRAVGHVLESPALESPLVKSRPWTREPGTGPHHREPIGARRTAMAAAARIDDREDRRARTDTERQRRYRDDGEARGTTQDAQRIVRVATDAGKEYSESHTRALQGKNYAPVSSGRSSGNSQRAT